MQEYEKKHLALLREHLAECTVLLKNNGDFPLDKADKIAAYGCGVRRTIKGGTGSGEVNSRYFVTVEQGLKDAGFEITTERWLNAYDDTYEQARKQFIVDMKAEAKAQKKDPLLYAMGRVMPEPEYTLPLDGEGDTAIYVLARNSGEGNDRAPVAGDIKLSATEKRDILALNQKYSKFMLVLNVGGAVDLSEIGGVENILLLSQLGVDTGAALADILLGKANPSGKLTTTWSAWEDYADMGEFGGHNDTRYNEGVYVGYRYFDSVGKKAQYPFGFGKSFTQFHMSGAEVFLDRSKVTVTADVENVGKLAGKEVVQVYVSSPEGSMDKPYQALAGFAKTGTLQPGQKETVKVSFDMTELVSYNAAKSAYVLEPGNYIVRVGNSSVDTTPAAQIQLDREVVVTKVRSSLGGADFADWKPEARAREILPENLNTIVLDADCMITKHIQYDLPGEVDLLFALSDHGYLDAAYDVLLQEECPGWMYEVKAGGTTIWERWDGLRADGSINTGDLADGQEKDDGGMISFNHYANGAVGDWLYRRVAGIEPICGGYKEFKVAPMPGGGLTYARAEVRTPYGKVLSDWKIVDSVFDLTVEVPVSTTCHLTLPDGGQATLHSGYHHFSVSV